MRVTTGRRIERSFLLAVLLIATICSGGCWDRYEIESIAFVNAMGVDLAGSGNVLVTFYVVNPSAMGKQEGGGGKEPPANVASIEAPDISEAITRFAEESPRTVRLKQMQVIIIGEDLARQGVGPALDFFSRQYEMRRSIWLLVAKGRAQDILVKGQSPPDKLASAGIRAVMQRRSVLSASRYPVMLGDFLTDLARPGVDPIASSIELYPMREATTGGPRGGDGLAAAGGSAAEGGMVLAFRGAGVFQDDRLLGFLGPDETRGVLWVQGKVRGGRFVVPAGSQEKGASLAVERESTDVEPSIGGDRIRFLVTIHEEGYIESVDRKGLEVEKSAALDLLEREEEKAIRQQVVSAVSKAQSLQSDFIGLGDRLYRKYPDAWNQIRDDWNTVWLPRVEVDVSVKCKLRHTGTVTDPLLRINR